MDTRIPGLGRPQVLSSAALGPVLTAAGIALSACPAAAAVVERTVSGAQSYGIHAGEFVNGDFTVRACCGEPSVGDATEEWTSWVYSFAGDPELSAFSAITAINAATLELRFRTGGDTPADDVLTGSLGVASPFSFAGQFSTYEVTLDLLSLYGQAGLLSALNGNRELSWQQGNDSSPYWALLRLDVSGTPAPGQVPEPGAIWLVGLAGLAATLAGLRGARRTS